MMLAHYFGSKVKIVQKTTAHKPGNFIFSGSEPLKEGVYMILDREESKLFEFLIDQDQYFSLYTTPPHYIQSMKVKGSKINKLFFDYLKFNEPLYKQIKKLTYQKETLDRQSEASKTTERQIDSLKKVLADYKQKTIHESKNSFLKTLLLATNEIPVPDSVKNAGNNGIYRYYRDHYWDLFDLSDGRLLRTPIYDQKVQTYFKQLVPLEPDSVIHAINTVISKAQPNKEAVSHLVWLFTSEYQNPKYIGFDTVFVYLVDHYFKKMNIDHTTPSIKKALEKRADQLRPLLEGKTAPNLILQDTTGSYRSFMSLTNDYIILLFWDYSCSVCKKEIKTLQKLLKENDRYELTVFAVNTNSNLDEWKKAIQSKGMTDWINVNGTRSVTPDFHQLYLIDSTPVIILLDKNKKILAKRLAAKNVLDFLNLLNRQQRK